MLALLSALVISQAVDLGEASCIVVGNTLNVQAVLKDGTTGRETLYSLTCASWGCDGAFIDLEAAAAGGVRRGRLGALGDLETKTLGQSVAVITWGTDNKRFVVDFVKGTVVLTSRSSQGPTRAEGTCKPKFVPK